MSEDRLKRMQLHSRLSLKVMPTGEYESWKQKLESKGPNDYRRLLEGFEAAHSHGTLSTYELKFLKGLFDSELSWGEGVGDEEKLTLLSYTQVMTGNIDVRIPREYLRFLSPEERKQVPASWIMQEEAQGGSGCGSAVVAGLLFVELLLIRIM